MKTKNLNLKDGDSIEERQKKIKAYFKKINKEKDKIHGQINK